MAEHRYCEDCVWFRPVKTLWWRDANQNFARCAHPSANSQNLVTRDEARAFCSIMRQYSCGLEGKLWERA